MVPERWPAAGFEFIWPSGSKTILVKDGANLTLNGKPAYAVPESSYSVFVVNGDTGNRFCFNKGYPSGDGRLAV